MVREKDSIFFLINGGGMDMFRLQRRRRPKPADKWFGALAQLGERFAGSEEVRGSIPLGSTIFPP